MSDAPSIGVLIPTRNCAPLLREHAGAFAEWVDLAEEIVVVDSDSQDGTLELLKGRLPARTSWLTHPPGLYQSWNFGIQKLRTEYTYIATVGDSITRPGLAHLWRVAEQFQSDVVISKPVFMADGTRPAADIRWPVDDLIETLRVTGPQAVSWPEVLLFTAVHLDGTLLGSSASNLYRTEVLQKFPFPSDFGKAGDAAWAARNFARVKWAVTPEKFSTFLRHPDVTGAVERENWKTSARLDQVLRDAVETAVADGIIARTTLETHGIPELLAAAGQWLDGKQAFDRQRARGWPWYLNPAAWHARSLRNGQFRRVLRCRDQTLARLRTESATGSSAPESSGPPGPPSAAPKRE